MFSGMVHYSWGRLSKLLRMTRTEIYRGHVGFRHLRQGLATSPVIACWNTSCRVRSPTFKFKRHGMGHMSQTCSYTRKQHPTTPFKGIPSQSNCWRIWKRQAALKSLLIVFVSCVAMFSNLATWMTKNLSERQMHFITRHYSMILRIL